MHDVHAGFPQALLASSFFSFRNGRRGSRNDVYILTPAILGLTA